MIKLITGKKGTGKTKIIIERINEAVKSTNGNIVCIEKGEKLRYDVKYQARLINTNEYFVMDAQTLYGFVAGILASNHDVTDLFIDSALKICNDDMFAFDQFVEKVHALAEKLNVSIVMTASLAVEDASETVKKYI